MSPSITTGALDQITTVLVAILATIGPLALLGLGIAFGRMALLPTEEKRAMASSQIFHILGVTAGIGCIGALVLWISKVIFINPYLDQIPF